MLSRQPLLLVLASATHALVAPQTYCRPVSPTVYHEDVLLRTSGRARVALAASTDEPQNPVAQDAPIYALAAALQAVPLVLQTKESHYVFFLGLATATVYLSSRAPSLAPPEAEPLTMKQAALAPVLASVSLFSLYALIKYLSIDPSLGYRLLTSAFAGGASSLVLYEAADAVSSEDAPIIGGVIAFILVALYLGADALQLSLEAKTGIANFLGWSLALLAPRTVPLRSFGVGAALLGGLFLYDIFFVFGSDVMMTVATKIDAPVVLKAPNPPDAATPYALLGLGDVALPSLLVSFLGRYGDARGERAWRLTATSAYAVGLLMAFAANEYWRAGQPALLYLVPATVGAGLCTALATGGRPAVEELLAYKEPAPEYKRSR